MYRVCLCNSLGVHEPLKNEKKKQKIIIFAWKSRYNNNSNLI